MKTLRIVKEKGFEKIAFVVDQDNYGICSFERCSDGSWVYMVEEDPIATYVGGFDTLKRAKNHLKSRYNATT